MFDASILKGKTIVVTGGGSGLGLAMAGMFVHYGANVAICGRTLSKLEKAAEGLREKARNADIFYESVDVRDYDAVGTFLNHVVEKYGSYEGVVNNAAGNFLAPSEELTPNAFKSVVDIVLTGAFNVSHHAGKYWIENNIAGSIINITTTYAQSGSAFVMPSACAKGGVQAMTGSLAYEWGTYGIRVNAIAPGPFPTKGAWSRLMPDPKMEQMYKSRIPLGRYGEHDELANLAVFLMSDLSGYISGETITIDGGEHLQSGQFNIFAQLMPRDQLKRIFHEMKNKRTSK